MGGGVTASALALSGLILNGEYDIVDPDDIVRGLGLNYENMLNSVSSANEVEAMINRYAMEVSKSPIVAKQIHVGTDAETMLSALVGNTGPAKHGRDCVVVLRTDLNVASGLDLITVEREAE